jgi:hypothetical protein
VNKIFKFINYSLFIINTLILFSCYTHILDFSFSRLTICAGDVLILLVLNLIQLKRKNKIIIDEKYNIMLLLVNIIVLIIFIRDKFDTMIPLGSANDIAMFNTNSSGLFIDYNTIFITIMYTGILMYNLLNKGKK